MNTDCFNNEPIFRIRDIGKDVSSRTAAHVLRDKVLDLILDEGVERVVLDFEGVRTVTHSFSDELIAVLVSRYGKEWLRDHIRVVNCAEEHIAEILAAVEWRLAHRPARRAA